jgi:hypothetical protein
MDDRNVEMITEVIILILELETDYGKLIITLGEKELAKLIF